MSENKQEDIIFDHPVSAQEWMDWKIAAELYLECEAVKKDPFSRREPLTAYMIRKRFCPSQFDYSISRFKDMIQLMPKLTVY